MVVDGANEPMMSAAYNQGLEPFTILSTPQKVRKVALLQIKNRLRDYIGNISAEMAEEIGCKVSKIILRDTVSRWGSCSSNGNLSFSWRLAFAPTNVLDYVVAHEVCSPKGNEP